MVESDDPDVEEMLFDDDAEHLLLLHLIDKFEDENKKSPKSTVSHLCIPQNQALGHNMLMKYYFDEVPTYLAHLFHRRYPMCRPLFICIVEACERSCHFVTRRRNATGLLGFSAYQNISTTMRVIAYGIQADYTD